jgi:hypothetical protein
MKRLTVPLSALAGIGKGEQILDGPNPGSIVAGVGAGLANQPESLDFGSPRPERAEVGADALAVAGNVAGGLAGSAFENYFFMERSATDASRYRVIITTRPGASSDWFYSSSVGFSAITPYPFPVLAEESLPLPLLYGGR